MNDTLKQALETPCPCCGSTNLTSNLWTLNDGEVDAVECSDCYAGAPATSWIKRAANQEIAVLKTRLEATRNMAVIFSSKYRDTLLNMQGMVERGNYTEAFEYINELTIDGNKEGEEITI